MLTPDHALPKTVGIFMLAATIFSSLPQPAHADPVRVAETNEKKLTKKNNRKRAWSTAWGSSQGTAFAIPPRDGTAFARLPKAAANRTPAEIAIATARAQIGKPYRYGSTGPGSFDCSGLMRYAWAAAGVALPRTSGSQFGSLRRVSLDDMRPGDLVYRPGHIGMYIGKGRMVHAPHSGRTVEISPLGRTVGAVRPK